ncbi:major facilitator superfamily MFS1 protein [Desulfosarcina variabilis str. Montpellier]|uniref:tRNA (N6-threonylcarbamoyladenosine(37)-N6)-methyltransferase TrmO n=1 Tax=Desulfosarcina variabilis TaxID=2300 RepID=UPI003AFB3264
MNANDRKIFGTLFFSIFAAVTGVGIVVPLLPVYAHDLGASGIYIGLIFGAFSLSRTFFLPYFGRRSDKKGRKPLIVTGLFSYAVISVAFILSKGVEALIVIRFIQGITSAMIMPVVQAYVGDITPKGKEGWIMGLFNMSLFIGLSAGPLLGGVIKDRFSLQGAFACMGILSILGFALSLLFLPPVTDEHVVKKGLPPLAWSKIMKDRTIIGLFAYRLVHTACIGIIWGFLPVLADTDFSISASAIGILVMIGVCVSGIIQIPMGWIADRVNRKVMVFLGGLITTGAVYGFNHATGFNYLFWDSVAFGIGGGIAMPALMAAAVLRGSLIDAMGSVMALLTVAHSLGMLIGSVMAGVMMDMFDLKLAFTLGAAVMILGTILFMACTWRTDLNTGATPPPRRPKYPRSDMAIPFSPIGVIHTPFTDLTGMPIQPAGARDVIGKIVLDPQYEPGLKDLDGFSHLILIYHFHRSKGFQMTVEPFLDTVARGLFATRAPRRPNPIGLSIVRLLNVEKNELTVQGIDVLDQTPLLDIKPWVPAFDIQGEVRVGWMEKRQGHAHEQKSDDRFVEEKRKR